MTCATAQLLHTTDKNCTSIWKQDEEGSVDSVAGDGEKEFLLVNCEVCFVMS